MHSQVDELAARACGTAVHSCANFEVAWHDGILLGSTGPPPGRASLAFSLGVLYTRLQHYDNMQYRLRLRQSSGLLAIVI